MTPQEYQNKHAPYYSGTFGCCEKETLVKYLIAYMVENNLAWHDKIGLEWLKNINNVHWLCKHNHCSGGPNDMVDYCNLSDIIQDGYLTQDFLERVSC